MIRRQKHSQTQIKRLFKDHPARLRVEKRMWNIDRAQPRVIVEVDETLSTTSSTPVMDTSLPNTTAEQLQHSQETKSPPKLTPELVYPPIYSIPTILPNGWFPPMDPKLRPEYQFSI